MGRFTFIECVYGNNNTHSQSFGGKLPASHLQQLQNKTVNKHLTRRRSVSSLRAVGRGELLNRTGERSLDCGARKGDMKWR